jgi:hypothetical protein
MYESRRQPLLGQRAFLKRLLAHLAAAFALVLGSIGIGMAGYMCLEGLEALDAFLDTAMLLGGMGPIATAALVLEPLVHRVLHRFHLDRE